MFSRYVLVKKTLLVGARKCHKVFGPGQGCLYNEAKKYEVATKIK